MEANPPEIPANLLSPLTLLETRHWSEPAPLHRLLLLPVEFPPLLSSSALGRLLGFGL